MPPSYSDNAIHSINDSIKVKQAILEHNMIESILKISDIIAKALQRGNKLLICGNGGSAADAQHLAAELLIRLRPTINRQSLPAITLVQDTSTITACANDYGYECIFERLLQSLGRPGDILLGISTSGNSENVNRALQSAKLQDIIPTGFLGSDGGKAKQLCQEAFIVPSHNTARIQESHIMAGHILMETIEDILITEDYLKLK